jgi:transposase-like protein
MKKQRKQYAPEEKVAILKAALAEKEPISKLCDEVGLQPTVFYRRQKEFFENGLLPSSRNGQPALSGVWVPHDVRDQAGSATARG